MTPSEVAKVAESKGRLSATMVACLDDAEAAGGELVRFQGCYWAPRNVARRSHDGVPVHYHGASTVHALVTRGYARYSEYRQGRRDDFPIAMRLTDHLRRSQ